MANKIPIHNEIPKLPGWREYQTGLQKKSIKIPGEKRIYFAAGAALLIVAVFTILAMSGASDKKKAALLADKITVSNNDGQLIDKKDVQILLGKTAFTNLNAQTFQADFDGRPLTVETSLDIELQNHILKKMDRKNSRYIGVVAMDPDSGRIIALASFDKTDPGNNTCIEADYPAASIFKIVTAAAVVEKYGYKAESSLKYNGYAHTLYKTQLKDRSNRYTNRISFKKAFAQSINPVFGKIGTLTLKKEGLAAFGTAFLFNTDIPFETRCSKSQLKIKPETYHWAEIASGFNRLTRISPLHGAVIASIPVNMGKVITPTIVNSIKDLDGTPIYTSRPIFEKQAISEKTAVELKKLMAATITSGTGRKIFRNRKRNKTLSRLTIGGKTGNIFNRAHDARFDWFVGYAQEKAGKQKLVVSVMVAHEEFIGVRAGQYARMTLERYFKNYFAQHKPEPKSKKKA